MAKSQKRSNKAKSLVAQPLFRSRQEQPKKGKGSYRREASQSDHWGLHSFWQLEKPSHSKRANVSHR